MGNPFYKGPFPPFIDQGREGATMWDKFPPTYYVHFPLNRCTRCTSFIRPFLPVSTPGRNSSRHRRLALRAISAIVNMCCFLAHALPLPLGCFVCFCLVAALVVALVVFPAALDLLPVQGLVHYPSLVRLAHCQSPEKLVLCPSPVGQLLPPSVWPSVLPIPLLPQPFESVPSPVAEILRPLEPVLSPAAPDSALVCVALMSRPVLRQPPSPWFPSGSSVRNPRVPVLASTL